MCDWAAGIAGQVQMRESAVAKLVVIPSEEFRLRELEGRGCNRREASDEIFGLEQSSSGSAGEGSRLDVSSTISGDNWGVYGSSEASVGGSTSGRDCVAACHCHCRDPMAADGKSLGPATTEQSVCVSSTSAGCQQALLPPRPNRMLDVALVTQNMVFAFHSEIVSRGRSCVGGTGCSC